MAKSTAGLSPGFATSINSLIRASGGKVWLVSGYRSVERQTQLWNAAVKKYGSEKAARKWVAPPGRSRHNHGIAADLGGDLKLAAKLAAQFGLYRPMSWEPWHFEPRGSKADPQAQTAPPKGHRHYTGDGHQGETAADDLTQVDDDNKNVGTHLRTILSLFDGGDDGTEV